MAKIIHSSMQMRAFLSGSVCLHSLYILPYSVPHLLHDLLSKVQFIVVCQPNTVYALPDVILDYMYEVDTT